jgi:hypothetical protein
MTRQAAAVSVSLSLCMCIYLHTFLRFRSARVAIRARREQKERVGAMKSTRSKFKAPRMWKENPCWTSSRFSSTRPLIPLSSVSSVSGVFLKTLPSSSARCSVQARRTCPCVRAGAASCQAHAALEVPTGLPLSLSPAAPFSPPPSTADGDKEVVCEARSGEWVFANAQHLRKGIL